MNERSTVLFTLSEVLMSKFENKQLKFAIGPMVGLPSTEWVGRDIADQLESKGIKIVTFNGFNDDFEADVIFIVKIMPSLEWLIKKSFENIYLVYFPVDIFDFRWKEWLYKEHFKYFDLFYIHSTRIANILTTKKKYIRFVNHYLKYSVKRGRNIDKRNILWVGHLEYLPSLMIFFEKNHIDSKQYTVLADLEKFKYYAKQIKEELCSEGIRYTEEWLSKFKVKICGHTIEQWTEEKQRVALETCVAAIDTKLEKYGHSNKPPTKAQKYIFNGIPFAAPKSSYSYEYFSSLGLEIPDPSDLDILNSSSYRKKVEVFNKKFRYLVDIENVAQSYINFIKIDERRDKPKYLILSKLRGRMFFLVSSSMKAVYKIVKEYKKRKLFSLK